MSDRPLRLSVVILVGALLWSLLGWYWWHPGGPLNEHVWMSEQVDWVEPEKPAPTLKDWTFGDTGTGYYANQIKVIVPMQIDIHVGSKPVTVKLDVCIKHGEWRVLP